MLSRHLLTLSAHSKHAREKALSHFHQIRITLLPRIWKKHEENNAIPATKAVLAQSINQWLFSKLY